MRRHSLILAVLLAACETREPPGPAVVAYRWSGGGTVPNHGRPLALPPPRGALGWTEATRLYLGFEVELERELALPRQAWTLDPTSTARRASEGAVGGGLALGRSESLRLTRTSAWNGRGPWSLELSFRTRAGQGGRIVTVPGRLVLALRPDGELRLECPALEPPLGLRTSSPSRADGWHHLGLVVDPLDTRTVRIVLDGCMATTDCRTDLAGLEPGELVLGDASRDGGGLACTLDELRLQARAAGTTEFAEHAWPSPRPVVEHLHLETAAGTEELEVWAAPLTSASLGSEDWARGELEHVIPGPGGLLWVPGDWRREPAVDPPPGRTTHPTVSIGDGRVLLFGGEVSDTHGGPWVNTDDTWLYDTRALRWSRLETPLAPPPRCHVPIAWSPELGIALLYGGWWNEGASKVYADTWVFDARELRWEQRHPARKPGPMSDHGLVYHPRAQRFLLCQTGAFWSYDPGADKWLRLPPPECVDARGMPASHTFGSVCTAIDPASGLVLLFGGSVLESGHMRYTDTTALYDLERNRLTVLAPRAAPSPRVRSALAWDPRGERFVLFGGVQDEDSERMADLWSFSLATREWTELESAHAPSARGGYFGMAWDPATERFFLPCGRPALDRLLAEIWSLDLDERAPGRARYVFEPPADGRRGEWFAETRTPGSSSVGFRFRSSADALHWSAWAAECAGFRREDFVEVEIALRPGSAGDAPEVIALGFR